MKKNFLTIIANSQHSNFGFGDYLRILSFAPNLKYKKIIWISDKKLFPIAKNSDHLHKICDIKNKNNFKLLSQSDLVIDLFNFESKFKNHLLLAPLIKKTNNIKIDSIDICDVLAKKLKFNKYKLHANYKKFKEKKIIFFNWITPFNWRIKRYPKKKWYQLEKKIHKNFNDFKVVWQKEEDDLNELFAKIKKSKFVISIVGLGCHISMLYNKKFILLVGPTYFNEIELYKKVKIIKPESFCKFRPCHLFTGVNHCGCMGDIRVDNVFSELKKMITHTNV